MPAANGDTVDIPYKLLLKWDRALITRVYLFDEHFPHNFETGVSSGPCHKYGRQPARVSARSDTRLSRIAVRPSKRSDGRVPCARPLPGQ